MALNSKKCTLHHDSQCTQESETEIQLEQKFHLNQYMSLSCMLSFDSFCLFLVLKNAVNTLNEIYHLPMGHETCSLRKSKTDKIQLLWIRYLALGLPFHNLVCNLVIPDFTLPAVAQTHLSFISQHLLSVYLMPGRW